MPRSRASGCASWRVGAAPAPHKAASRPRAERALRDGRATPRQRALPPLSRRAPERPQLTPRSRRSRGHRSSRVVSASSRAGITQFRMTNVLLVTTVDANESDLSEELQRAIGDRAAEVRVVAPATDVSKLDWLTNDEDDARAEAREAPSPAPGAVESSSVEIDQTSHDTDAAQAVVDALRGFEADEIVVVTRPGDDSNWLDEEAVT